MRGICIRAAVAALAFVFVCLPVQALACPFCDAIRPTWSQLREPADIVALAKVVAVEREGATDAFSTLSMVESDRGNPPESLRLSLSAAVPIDAHVLLLGRRGADATTDQEVRWVDVPLSRAAYLYLQAAPDLRTPGAERLEYFAGFLQHQDPLIAEDAFMEFAHAPYDDVKAAAEAFNAEAISQWLIDPAVPDSRRGFYALALALAPSSDDGRAAHVEFLRGWVTNPGDDFRPGLDGAMGALLLTEDTQALELITEKYLANPDSANGHVRHAVAAIRFYYEAGDRPDVEAIAAAVEHLLDRPAFATETIADLARWEHWAALPRIVRLFDAPGYDTTTRRAVVAYLLTCDSEEADRQLTRLREIDAEFVDNAEERFLLFGTIR